MPEPLPPITPGGLNPGYLRDLVRKSAPVILEIGANDGTHTLEFLKAFPKARINAFEPDPRAFAKFKARITNPRVSAFEMAIGATDGEAEFHVSSGLPPNFPLEHRVQYPQGMGPVRFAAGAKDAHGCLAVVQIREKNQLTGPATR